MNCVLLACFLPSSPKRKVIKEIFDFLERRDSKQTIFVGIQANSIPETEEIIRKSKGKLNVLTRRVTYDMQIDSDASAFLAALDLYRESDMNFEKCFFCHTKGITSGNDRLRGEMYQRLFDTGLVDDYFKSPNVGSYGPYLTVTDVKEDIAKMGTTKQFVDASVLPYTVMEYYYINTFFVMKNEIVKKFCENVDNSYFTTPIQQYSDRYYFERDFSHIADMMGYFPSFAALHGNYSIGYRTPAIAKVHEKYQKWRSENGI